MAVSNNDLRFIFKEVKGLISACIVTRNSSESLRRYLTSLMSSVGNSSQVEIIVVDNESTDNTKDMLEEFFPQAQYIYCQPGIGFSKGINQAVAVSRGEFILIATPSTEIRGDAIPILLEYLKLYEDVGVVGPKIINPDGTTQHSSKKMPTPKVAVFHSLYLFGVIQPNKLLDEYFLYDYKSDEPVEVQSLTMSLLLIRRSVFESAGFLDEGLFVWASDVDWCYVVERSGWKQIFVPRAIAVHRRYSVSKKQPYSNLLHYHRDLNFFYKKHFSHKNGPITNFIWVAMLQVRFVLQIFRYLVRGGKDYSFY
ncbi:glycosyltransferase family 2 protein [Candidatus Villigracilis affinis]|uniref:glycosyltransferase family 2 protein n=1 Tax=Candidatus Villigracilis affinis TaxID=3140682 RepID=UPI002A20C1D8|nr:glycosyltransferase family 2 protein [Anaerolineales bacterium]